MILGQTPTPINVNCRYVDGKSIYEWPLIELLMRINVTFARTIIVHTNVSVLVILDIFAFFYAAFNLMATLEKISGYFTRTYPADIYYYKR